MKFFVRKVDSTTYFHRALTATKKKNRENFKMIKLLLLKG